MRNEANFHQRADREIGVPGGNRAKQTQLGPVRIRAKYIAAKKLGAIRRNMDTGETKPIIPLRIGGQTCRLRPAQANCVKQTQFPAGKIPQHSTIPSFRYSKREPTAQNKANFGRLPAAGRGPAAPNKANWRAGTLARPGPLCETNPIGRVRKWLLTVGWNKA